MDAQSHPNVPEPPSSGGPAGNGIQVTIREAAPEDAEQLLSHVDKLSTEPDIDVPLGPGEFSITVDEERKILTEYAASDNSIFLIAVVNGQIIGSLNCRGGKRRALRHSADLGISVSREWRDRGVGHALMSRALEWARGTGIVKRLELKVYARNARGIHLYEKFGFQIEGRRRAAVYQNGEFLDDLIMGVLLD